MSWKCLETKVLLQHPRMTLVEDKVLLPNGLVTSYIRAEGRTDAVTILCLRGDEILMQREYAYPTGSWLIQFPGGKVEAGESFEKAAARELQEESGYAYSDSEVLGWYYLNNRRSNAKMHVVLAREVRPVEKTGGDAEEDIESFWLPVAALKDMIARGEITTMTVLAAWALFAKAL